MPRPDAEERIRGHLEALLALLTKYDQRSEAAVVARLLDLDHTDPGAFWETLVGIDMWGGAGALWEVLFIDGQRPPAEEKKDTRAYARTMVCLADEIEGLGRANARIKQVRDGLRTAT